MVGLIQFSDNFIMNAMLSMFSLVYTSYCSEAYMLRELMGKKTWWQLAETILKHKPWWNNEGINIA